MGITGRTLRWIAEFLKDRKIYIETADGKSREHPVNQGVPQGSVLSPLLFNCVMAELAHVLPAYLHYSLYADDLCTWASGSNEQSVQQRLQTGLIIINEFLKSRGPLLSHEKTAMLPFTRKCLKRFQLKIDSQRLQLVWQHKFLGVILDRRLSWAPQTKALEAKVNGIINILRRIAGVRWGSSTSSLLRIHAAIIKQRIAYSAPALHGISRSLEDTFQRLMARSLRVCLCVPRASASALVIAESHQPTFYALRFTETCRHYFRLATQHANHPLYRALHERTGARMHESILQCKNLLPAHEYWPASTNHPPW